MVLLNSYKKNYIIKTPMDLLTFRIIGHPAIPDSSWFKVGRGLNVLRTGHQAQAVELLRMLQTINPPYDFGQIQPFADLPSHTSSQQHTKRIILSKKTTALAIFGASPELVTELAAIDAALYETDRIEFGRRRDFSRWINFVELSGSTRWSEIEPTVRLLLSRIKPEVPAGTAGLQIMVDSLRGVDRIKDERATQLKELLQSLRQSLPEKEQPLLDQCLHAIDRDHHFRRAKEVVATRLPLFLFISGNGPGGLDRGTPSNSALKTDPDPFAFLVADLEKSHADQASWERCGQRINLRLQALHPEQALYFKIEGKAFFLENAQGSTPLSLADLPPGEKLQAMLAALKSLHEECYGCPPFFLLDFSALKLKRPEQAALLKTLLGYASRLQCLIAPSSLFLELCADFLKEMEKSEQPLITFIDVPRGTAH